MFQILHGRALAHRIRTKVKQRVTSLASQPGLCVILVGPDPASHTYVSIKQAACEEVGIRFEKFLYNANVSENVIIEKIQELNRRNDVDGILVQLPLPSQDAYRVIQSIDPNKDVDGFHPKNLQRLKAGKPSIVSAVALGVMKLIDEALKMGLKAKTGVIVSSPLFAEPLVCLLKEINIEIEVVDPLDTHLKEKTKTADLLIVAVGKPELIYAEMVKKGAIIIDVGTTKMNGKLLGDVDARSVELIAGALSPVPGGVGPMTVAMLLLNVLKAHELLKTSEKVF